MVTVEQFKDALAAEYEYLFKHDEEYAYSASRCTPIELAHKMTASLLAGTANKDGKAIKAVCKRFGIKHTYKAIKEAIQP